MSLTRFHGESTALLGQYDASSFEKDIQRSQELVRDQWLEAKRHHEIVAAILGNWTSGNCVEFMLPVTVELLTAGEMALHHKLWKRTIKRQVDAFFRDYSYLRGEKLTFEELIAVDISTFDEFDWASYDNKRIAASFEVKQLASSLTTWRGQLESHLQSTSEVDQIATSIRVLKRPKIEVAR